jgi:hypothetical protein
LFSWWFIFAAPILLICANVIPTPKGSDDTPHRSK